MGAIKQLINFAASGLDYDSDDRLKATGDSARRVNVSTNELGRDFVISNMKGTTEKSHSFTHDSAYSGASYTVIGSCYDDNRDAIYIAIYSTLSNHSILRYNYSDDSFDKICWDHTGLGFDIDYPLTDMYMIADFLHWNPRTSSPRSIQVQWAYWDFVAYQQDPNIADAIHWSLNDYVKQDNKVYKILASDIDRSHNLLTNATAVGNVEFIDWTYQDVDTYPPSSTNGEYNTYREFYNTPVTPVNESPYTLLDDDSDFTANYIRGNIFQFAYRVYVPGQGYTISSTFSPIIANPSDEAFDGEVLEEVTVNNRVEVGFYVGTPGDGTWPMNSGNWLFEFAEILFRKNNDPTWFLADRIYHADATTYATRYHGASTTYVCSTLFYNDRVYETIDSASIEKQYNALPVLARAQWPLDGERTAYGGVTEGYNAPIDPPLVTLTPDNRAVSLVPGAYTDLLDTIVFTKTDADIPGAPKWDFTTTSITTVPGTGPIYIKFTLQGVVYNGTADASDTAADYRQAIIDTMLQSPAKSAAIYDTDKIRYTSIIPDIPTLQIYDGFTGVAVTKLNSFKTNAEHPFCIFYYDDMLRRSDPITSVNSGTNGTTVFVPAIPDDGTLTLGTNHQQYINWEVDHYAPSWAKYWRWGYAGNRSISLFWQYNIKDITIGADALSGYALIDISGLQTIADETASANDNTHVNSNIGTYYFEPGDRVKFITKNTGSPTDTTELVIADTGYDYEIKGYDSVNFLLYIDAEGADGTPYTDYSGLNTVIEIYRPDKDNVNLEFFETGDLYDVVESGGLYLHKGETQDQTSSLPATGEHGVGDVYLISRQVAEDPGLFTAGDPIFVESYSWSDFYDSDSWGPGKIGLISGIGQVYMDNVRYSNKYSPNTLSSGVSEFDGLDYKTLSSEHGKITAMRQAGHVLKVYFERNSASVMVNKAQFLDADGVSQIVKSDDVLGTAEYSNYYYGTIFPESVFLIDRTVYFYDVYRKSYVRDSSNGVFAISDYKAVTKFSEISDAILTSGVGNVQVWTGYDPERNFVYVMFKDSVTPANDLVIVFNEEKNRWECTVEITAGDLLRATARDLISFIGEDLYIHNDNVNRGYFYTGYSPMTLDVVVNEQPALTKVLDSIALNTNDGEWDLIDVLIPPTPQYPLGMTSQIYNAMWTKRENGMYADFLRNMKTNSPVVNLFDLRNGEILRGQTALITLRNATTTEVVLYDVLINMTPSKI